MEINEIRSFFIKAMGVMGQLATEPSQDEPMDYDDQ